MQDYIDLANKKGVILSDKEKCQFCGAETSRGVHECVELFSLGFQMANYFNINNYYLRFLTVTDVLENSINELECQKMIERWGE